MNNVFVSGIQPTGCPHIGNYLGAIKNCLDVQANLEKDDKLILFIADLHALTQDLHFNDHSYDLRLNTLAMLLACGIDPNKVILFNQSDVVEHLELYWILSNITSIGSLKRMTQFKDKSSRTKSINAGLLMYPVLQAADILLYNATHVPVGADQSQHLELTRDLANKFNLQSNEFKFNLPETYLTTLDKTASLKDASNKMSKSDKDDNTRINLLDSNDLIKNKINKAKTSTGYFPTDLDGLDILPEVYNLMVIHMGLTGNVLSHYFNTFGSKSYSEFKNSLTEELIKVIEPIRIKYNELIEDKAYLCEVASKGAYDAVPLARDTLYNVKASIGF